MTPPSAPTTIRGLLERIRDRGGAPYWDSCDCLHCEHHRDAVAALDLWDAHIDRLGHAERGISFNGDSKSILQQILAADSSLLGGVVPTNTKEECQHEWRPSADGSVCAKCLESDR